MFGALNGDHVRPREKIIDADMWLTVLAKQINDLVKNYLPELACIYNISA
jgi:hypothetical protein